MEEIKKRAFTLSLIGAILGMAIVMILYMFGSYDDIIISNRGAFLTQMIGSMLLGFVNMGATVIYDMENWGLVKTTLTHYAISLGSFLIADIVLGWFDMSVMLIVVFIFTFVYFIIWLINYLKYKKEIRLINIELEKMNRLVREQEEA